MATVLTRSISESQSHPLSQEEYNISIRPASLNDLSELGKLWFYQRSYHEQWDELYVSIPTAQESWKKQIQSYLNQSNHCVFVAEDRKRKIIGYVHGSYHPWPISPFQCYGSLNTIAVAEEAQGQGIGKNLIKCLLGWFQKHQVHHISLFVDYRNQNALQLYQDMGFRSYQHRLMLTLVSESP
ncbi:MAG: GNAT family N-acetyltransferase [Candidatus Hermodarchaeota archaeon]